MFLVGCKNNECSFKSHYQGAISMLKDSAERLSSFQYTLRAIFVSKHQTSDPVSQSGCRNPSSRLSRQQVLDEMFPLDKICVCKRGHNRSILEQPSLPFTSLPFINTIYLPLKIHNSIFLMKYQLVLNYYLLSIL